MTREIISGKIGKVEFFNIYIKLIFLVSETMYALMKDLNCIVYIH